MNLLLTSSGFQQPHVYGAFRSMLGKSPQDTSVAIITTASEEWKEHNKHAVATKILLERDGFRKVQYIDVEHEDPELLQAFDAMFFNGGSPFHLLHHLQRSGAVRILRERAEKGTPIVGNSGGAAVFGSDLSLAAWCMPEMNTVGMTDLAALDLVPITLYPHYGRSDQDEEKIRAFERSSGQQVVRLTDTQAILIQDGRPILLSPTDPFPRT